MALATDNIIAIRQRQQDCLCKRLNLHRVIGMSGENIPRRTPQRCRLRVAVHAAHDTPSPYGRDAPGRARVRSSVVGRSRRSQPPQRPCGGRDG